MNEIKIFVITSYSIHYTKLYELKQFIGKTQNDDLRYGDNIVAISGATISVKSFTDAINNLLKSLKKLHSKKIL